eukprot:460662-Pyramimonas_sp.AAC.2
MAPLLDGVDGASVEHHHERRRPHLVHCDCRKLEGGRIARHAHRVLGHVRLEGGHEPAGDGVG